jgi:hypothetical protein
MPKEEDSCPIMLRMDVVHGVGRRRSMGVVEGLLMSLPGMLHRPPSPFWKAATDTYLYAATSEVVASQTWWHGCHVLLSSAIAFFSSYPSPWRKDAL